MNFLFDILHPAHVHLFRNFIDFLEKDGHHVVVTSREKDVTNLLLEYYGIDYVNLSKAAVGRWRLACELLQRDFRICTLHKKQKFDFAFGTSASVAHLSAVSTAQSFIFEEDDDDIIPLFAWLTYPFATKIIVPSTLRFDRWKGKRVTHHSLHELAYLHPDVFKPDKSVLEKYGLKPRRYIIARRSALKAHHDTGIKGFDEGFWREVLRLFEGYQILESREIGGKRSIDPWDMHSVLYFAKMLISDSQTMSIEAAVLGLPSIRYNSFVGKISTIEELETVYGLTFGFRPERAREMLEKIKSLLKMPDLETQFVKKRERLLREKGNFTNWMIDYFFPYLS